MQKGDTLKGFVLAGSDKKFYFAEAKIDGNKVVVSCKDVANPVAVRYGWADFPVVNLFNMDEIPASPFRTDDWK
jgi:sialate O-acetylesterase